MRTEIRHVPSDPDGKPWHFYRERRGEIVFRAKFAERYEAENCARRIKKFKDARTARWYWQGDETIAGVRYRPRGDSKEEVEAILAAIRLRLRQDRYDLPRDPEVVTLPMLVAERARDLDLSKKNHRRVRVVLEMFRDHFPASQRVDRLTDADVLSYKRARLAARRLKANSITRELEAVAAMFNAAGSYFPSLASWKHPRMHYEKEERRERVITRDEGARLLAALREPRRPGRPASPGAPARAAEQVLAHRTRLVVADLWEFAPLVGMRRSEMRLMEKSWIDFDEALLNLPRHVVKTRKARAVPLNDEALDILRRRCWESPGSKYVFTNARGTNVLGEYQMYRAIRKAAERAGVSYGRDVEGGFVLHDARHTAVTRMLQAGADLATVGDVVGHSKETMTLTYGHSTLESKRRAVAALGQSGKAVDKKLTPENGGGAQGEQGE